MLEHLRITNEKLPRKEPSVDFGPIHASIQEEGALLHPSLETMEESFAAGLASVYTEDVAGRKVAVGYSRLIPLLAPEQVAELGLPREFPAIAELGTVFVAPLFRGRGIAENLYRELFARFSEPLVEGRLLVLGTTKTAKVLHQLAKLQDMGLNFHAGSHTEFPHLAPVTCVCVPDFGYGFQFGVECPARITESDAQVVRDCTKRQEIILLSDVKRNGDRGKIPCTMFVSDRNLAHQTDRMIADAYGGREAQQTFVERLAAIDYYANE